MGSASTHRPSAQECQSTHPEPFGGGRRSMIRRSSDDARLPEGRVIGSLFAATTTASVQRRSLHGTEASPLPQSLSRGLDIKRLAYQRLGITCPARQRVLRSAPLVKSHASPRAQSAGPASAVDGLRNVFTGVHPIRILKGAGELEAVPSAPYLLVRIHPGLPGEMSACRARHGPRQR
jgi:hypothetical protein